MFLAVKHATNAGGAVAARDGAGEKEKMNIDILQRKWPGVFRPNARRKGVAGTEVTMNWNGYGKVSDKSAPRDAAAVSKESAMKVQKLHLKTPRVGKFDPNAVVKYTRKVCKSECLNKRCSKPPQICCECHR